MDKNLKGVIAVGVVVGAIALSLRYFFKSQKIEENQLFILRKNLGLPESKLDTISLKFNGEKNQVDFFSNNRFFIYKIENGLQKYIDRGTWSMGGYNLKLDSGKEAISNSVYKNLLDIIK